MEPPESIPNSEVKRSIADGSVGLPHVRVGHRQALIQNPRLLTQSGVFPISVTVNFSLSENYLLQQLLSVPGTMSEKN